MTWTTLCIAACWLLTSVLPAKGAGGPCRFCHTPAIVTGAHRGVSCPACHQTGGRILADPASRAAGAAGCVTCHRGYQRLFDHAMGSREKEQGFIRRSYGRQDRGFAQQNCAGCHLEGCRDCHGAGHALVRPAADACSRCHKGYFTGWDYFGRAPREENARYQRGATLQGETWLKMLPDVHWQKGMACGACHDMQSLIAGKVAAKGCTDCHLPSRQVIEHRIAAHLEKLECAACHAAWAAQEYGTFYLRFDTTAAAEAFDQLTRMGNGYARSVYLKRQDLPPLGLNNRGKVAPIRPQFIAYYSRIGSNGASGRENQLLAAEWRAFTPHTIQRGTPLCDACHDNPRRFLLERPQDRIYDLQQDGMTLASFWERTGQRVVNGSFVAEATYRRMAVRSPAYTQAYVQKWRRFVTPR